MVADRRTDVGLVALELGVEVRGPRAAPAGGTAETVRRRRPVCGRHVRGRPACGLRRPGPVHTVQHTGDGTGRVRDRVLCGTGLHATAGLRRGGDGGLERGDRPSVRATSLRKTDMTPLRVERAASNWRRASSHSERPNES